MALQRPSSAWMSSVRRTDGSIDGSSEGVSNRETCVSSDVPGSVKNLRVVDTADGEVSLAWEEPESDGGSKILAYVVERRDVKRKTWALASDRADAPEYCVTGLQKDSAYLFRVCARNRVGSGPAVVTEEAVQAKNKFGKLTNIPAHICTSGCGCCHLSPLFFHQMFLMLLRMLQWRQ